MSRADAQRGVAIRAVGSGRTVDALGIARAPLIGARHWVALSGDTVFVLSVDRGGSARVQGVIAVDDCGASGPAIGPFVPVDAAGRRLWLHRRHSDPQVVARLTAAQAPAGRPAHRAAAGSGIDLAVSRSWAAVAAGIVAAALLVAWAVAGWP